MFQVMLLTLCLEPIDHLGPDDFLLEVNGHLVSLFQQILRNLD